MLTSTVVLAMYNGSKYIVEQLDSLRKQSHQVEKVIISDDGSRDNSVEIVEEYIKKYNLNEHWQCRQNSQNMGYADNFWCAANMVETDIVFFCDQDDIWNSDKIEQMLREFEARKQILLLGSGYTPFTDSGHPYIDKALTKVEETGELEKIKLTNKTIFIGCEGCTMAVRTRFLKSLTQYHYDRAPHDEFVWKAALCVDGCYILHKSLMKRRFHKCNVTHNKMHDKNTRISFLKLLLKSHYSMLDYAKDLNLNSETIDLIQDNIDSVKLRIGLIQERKLRNGFVLFMRYRNNYHSKKALITEQLIALRKG